MLLNINIYFRQNVLQTMLYIKGVGAPHKMYGPIEADIHLQPKLI